MEKGGGFQGWGAQPRKNGAPKGGSCPHLAKPHLAKKIRIWPICFRDRIWPNRIWPELVFQSVDRIWPTAFGQFWCFNSLAKFSVVVVVVIVFVVVPVVPGWCLLVPIGACWWCLLVVVVCVCVVGVFWSSPLDLPPPDGPSPGPPKISLFFFSLPPEISFYLLSLGVVEFWWCF